MTELLSFRPLPLIDASMSAESGQLPVQATKFIELSDGDSTAPEVVEKIFPEVSWHPMATAAYLDAGDLVASGRSGVTDFYVNTQAGLTDQSLHFTKDARSFNQDTVGVFRSGDRTGLVVCDGRGGSADAAVMLRKLIYDARQKNQQEPLAQLPRALQERLLEIESRESLSCSTLTYIEVADDGQAQALVVGDSPFWIRRQDGAWQGPFTGTDQAQFLLPSQFDKKRYTFSGLPEAQVFSFQLYPGDYIVAMSDGVAHLLSGNFDGIKSLHPSEFPQRVVPVLDARVQVMREVRPFLKTDGTLRVETPYGWRQSTGKDVGVFYDRQHGGTPLGSIWLDNYTLGTLMYQAGAEILLSPEAPSHEVVVNSVAGKIYLRKDRETGERQPLFAGRRGVF